MCGASTFKPIKTLIPGTKLEETTFAQIVELVKQHHNPQPSEIVQHFHFNSCVCQQGESAASIVAWLHRLSEHCNYGDSLESMLRDSLVCGIGDELLQRQLLCENDLTFAKAFELCQIHESAESNTTLLNKPLHRMM